jgi:predicted dehydrogenase
MDKSRRGFLKKTAVGAAGISLGGLIIPSKAYSSVPGANDRLNFGIVGVNSRGLAHVSAVLKSPNTSIGYICDVDSRALDKTVKMVEDMTGKKPKAYTDIRKMLEEKDLDVITIATPEHWHAPMAIMGVQAGKHVYVEKPCSHNPLEGEYLIEAQRKYGKLIQMGNQQRSGPTSQQAMKDIKDGLIGRAYYGKAWYSNARASIGTGQKVPVPEWLNWELWQGPAPRRDYQDIWVHYNWHWIKDYGTGEIHNNGTHEIDICRWALGVDYPVKVTSGGGRFHFDDDWEFPDTQVVSYEFPENKMITWEGRSCNNYQLNGRGRGVTIHGTEGSIFLDRNEYIAYNSAGEETKRLTEDELSATTDTRGEGSLDIKHMINLVNGIRNGETLNAPISDGAITSHLCHLGNISQEVGRTIYTDKNNGRILGDAQAMQLWSREYEPGWEIHI